MVRFDTTRAASSGDGTFLPHWTLCYREWWLREGQARARGFGFLARVNLKIFLSLVFFWKSFIMFIIYPSCFYSNLTIKLPYNSE